jgi:hypothetical protein
MNKSVLTIFLLGVYLLAAMLSYLFFSSGTKLPGKSLTTVSNSTKKYSTNNYDAITFDSEAPKTQACPLNGALYSKEQEAWWKTHRPLGVMVENHLDARPQSGTSFADVVYESVAEGGITRFLLVYYCQDAGIIGPVRSARTYFMDYISEYGNYPLYVHVGGANTPGPANALGQIGDYGWNQYNDMNQFSIGYPTFKRDESRLGRQVATEHTMYSITNKLWDYAAEKRSLTNKDKSGGVWDETFVPYHFKDDALTTSRASSQTIHIDFWDSNNYAVDWVYQPVTNTYLRENGGVAYLDRNTNKQLSAKNIVVLFMTEAHANDGYMSNAHMLYGTKGTGKAFVFVDGKKIIGTWKKSDRTSRTILTDSSGQEIAFNRGTIWFEIQPIGSEVVSK